MKNKLGRKKLPIEEVKKRREEAFKLILQGIHIDAIAKSFGVTTTQINKDLFIIRREKAKYLKDMQLNERVGEYDESARQRIAKIWQILSDSTSKKREIIGALRLLQHEDELKIRRDQILGIIPRDNITNINFNKFDITTADSINITFEDLEQPKLESDTIKKEGDKVIDVESEDESL